MKKYCEHCGNELKEGSKFCECCGTPIDKRAYSGNKEHCKYRPGRAHCTVIECILSVTLVHAFRYIVHVVRLIL